MPTATPDLSSLHQKPSELKGVYSKKQGHALKACPCCLPPQLLNGIYYVKMKIPAAGPFPAGKA